MIFSFRLKFINPLVMDNFVTYSMANFMANYLVYVSRRMCSQLGTILY